MTWRKQNQIEAKFLRSQAFLGMERESDARALLGEVLQMDSNHAGAADLIEQLKWGWRFCARTDPSRD